MIPRCGGCDGLVREERGRCYLARGSRVVRWLCQGCQVGKPAERLYTPTSTPESAIQRVDPADLAPDPRDVLEGSE